MEGKWKVAFLCKNNTCRSQIAEALAKRLASDVMDVYSAGVELGKEMHDCAVRMLKETHGIDLVEEGYHTKLISDIPDVDIIIYMSAMDYTGVTLVIMCYLIVVYLTDIVSGKLQKMWNC